MTATYLDIRRLTGLSLSTISKYFNGGNILPANREAIERAVGELDFRPNAHARSLRTRRSRRVGVLVPALDVGFHMSIVAGIEAVLRAHGIFVLVRSAGGERDADGSAPEHLADAMVDGLFAVPRDQDEPGLAKVAARGIPLVFIDRPAGHVPGDVVLFDNRAAAATAARHLFDHGHRRLGVIAGDPGIWTMRERLAAVREVAAQRGVPLAEDGVISSELSTAAGRLAAMRLLALHPRPTAILISNYQLTMGALIAINESGLAVPDDVSIIGFDAPELSRAVTPSLTTVNQPVAEIARLAAELMVDRLRGDASEARRVVLPGELVVGGSVRNLARTRHPGRRRA